ncbi:MAG: oxidoreductase [Streptosporangiales bacterium]|nr:oxidoreductase [Streptosporangiales bacterium]
MDDPLARIAALPSVAEAVESARAGVDRLLGHRILRRRSADVSAESALRGARASAALSGEEVPLETIRAGDVTTPAVQGALRLSVEVGQLADLWAKAPRQVLARLHVLAAADAVPADDLGRPRTNPEVTGGSEELAVPPAELAMRLDGLTGLLTTPSAAPALVAGAIVHGELLALRPFGWGDGLVARAAERLTYIQRGLDPKSLVAPEVGYAETAGGYEPALRGYLAGDPEGVAGWVTYCAKAVELGARDSLAVCEALLRG